ncbi:hypothetical protein [Longimicrobium sp.]|jgi:hypothetical protein|uniref:hypothetical protein n=1 Tax=Longimicrobium sp. TaxID=2029185 RepID=UPI002F94CCB8
MMDPKIKEQLRERIMANAGLLEDHPRALARVDAILADVEAVVTAHEQKAFADGVRRVAFGNLTPPEQRAAEAYPMPTVTVKRAREVPDPAQRPENAGLVWALIEGRFQFKRTNDPEWTGWNGIVPAAEVTTDRVRVWADLLADPDETVEVQRSADDPLGDVDAPQQVSA